MSKIAIIGAGDLGQQIAYFATQTHFEVVGFFDDTKEQGQLIQGIPILGKIENIQILYEQGVFQKLLVGIGYKHMHFRAAVFDKFFNKIPFARLIHSSCNIDATAEIGEGTVIFPGCLIDQQVKVKENVLINVACSVSHHTEIGAHSFLSPRVAIAGFVKVGNSCILGINSTIIDNLKIVEGTQLGGGTVLIKNVDKKGLYVGNPARFIR